MSDPNYLASRLRQARWHRVEGELSRRTVLCGSRLPAACPLLGARGPLAGAIRPRRPALRGPRGVERKSLSENLLKGSRRL